MSRGELDVWSALSPVVARSVREIAANTRRSPAHVGELIRGLRRTGAVDFAERRGTARLYLRNEEVDPRNDLQRIAAELGLSSTATVTELIAEVRRLKIGVDERRDPCREARISRT